MQLIINIITINFTIYIFGIFASVYLIKIKTLKDNIHEAPLYGLILLGFLSLLINFLFPINKIIGSLILIISIFFFIYHKLYYKNIFKKILKNILIVSILTFILIAYSNINRPDAGLYHLPFINIINENKIIFGLANIHSRFGYASILQYLSGLQNSYFLNLSSLNIPIASIFSFSFIYFIKELKKNLNKEKIINSILIFLITFYALIGFNRFSAYGNDVAAHLFLFIFFIMILNNFSILNQDIQSFKKIYLISVFLFSIKPFMAIIILITFILFMANKKKIEILKNKLFWLINLFLFFWILKTFIISGCLIYPLSKTCFNNLEYSNKDNTIAVAKIDEAWAKGWPDYKKKEITIDKFNKNFFWLNTWKTNHLKIIFKKLGPFIIFLILFLIILRIKKSNIKLQINESVYIILLSSFLIILIWFIKFPVYRFGNGSIITCLSILFIIILNQFKLIPNIKDLKKYFKFFIILGLTIFFTKNIKRIYDYNLDNNLSIWPDIYSEINDFSKVNLQLVNDNDVKLYYYSYGKLCMYSKSPCSNNKIKNLKKKKFFSYDYYYITN